MNKIDISLKYKNAIIVSNDKTTNDDTQQLVASLNASLMQLGYVLSSVTATVLMGYESKEKIIALYDTLIPALLKAKGANVQYTPMYPNFPAQVMEMSEYELYWNAIIHYYSFGKWKPDYEKLPRKFSYEYTKFKEIDSIDEEEFADIFTQILSSADSISEYDKKVVRWFIHNYDKLNFPDEIPFKENMCFVAGILFELNYDISSLIQTTTDVLRVATYLSGGDISLATNTKFKSLPRHQRRSLVAILENVINEEDIKRHKGKWNKLFHNLHVGELSEKVNNIAKKVRNNEKLETFNGKVQHAIDTKNVTTAVKLLSTRPGEFARKLDVLLRMKSKKKTFIVDEFEKVANNISTRILMQLLGHFKSRLFAQDAQRVVFPKGNVQRAYIIKDKLDHISNAIINRVLDVIKKSLLFKFSKMPELGAVYIDPALKKCPLPTQQRSASEGLFQVARGTQLPFGDDKNTLRFFIYWIGEDIDLSASLHDEKFNLIEHISYTNLRSNQYNACHSGDITRAPNGAAEFIDITVDDAVKYGARYVVMNVLVYSGPNFSEHKACYAGWMEREKPESNEIFDPKTVTQKIDLVAESRNSIPVVFDLVERKAIWTDLNTSRNVNWGGNNIESSMASITDTLQAITRLDNKATLYELFELHALSRGVIIDDEEEADVVFSIENGITPYNITEINSEYII